MSSPFDEAVEEVKVARSAGTGVCLPLNAHAGS